MQYVFYAYLSLFALVLLYRALAGAVSLIVGLLAHRTHQASQDRIFDPAVVVTLVHGTWARSADWTRPTSPLCRTLASATRHAIQFEHFLWTGSNSMIARHRAVRGLTRQLRESIDRWPDAKHVVIGHSHGGNIAFHTLHDHWLAQRLDGIVCLSTPFLNVLERELNTAARIGIICSPFAIVLYLSAYFGAPSDFLFYILPGGAFACAGFWYSSRKLRRYVVEAGAYPAPASNSAFDPKRILLIRTVADEATAAISLAYAISRLFGVVTTMANGFLTEIFTTIEQWKASLLKRRILLTLSLAVPAALAVYSVFFAGPEPAPAVMLVFGLSLVYLLATLAVITTGGLPFLIFAPFFLAHLTAPFVAIAAICGIAIGPELCIAGVWFYLSAESTPPGPWYVWQLVPARAGGDASLLHSMSYNDPDALNIIRCWFHASLGLDERAPT